MGSGNSENESVLNICTFKYMYKYIGTPRTEYNIDFSSFLAIPTPYPFVYLFCTCSPMQIEYHNPGT